MFRLIVSFAFLMMVEGRDIQRFIREAPAGTANTNALNSPSVNSELVAPSPGNKPLVAKYTIRVKPKLKDGVPQIQEIRIMPPRSNSTQDFVKPLMVLKQNITRTLVENIEIDVPRKGTKFSPKPIVEVLEDGHKELLNVTKGGEALVENPAQKSSTGELQDDHVFAVAQMTSNKQNQSANSTQVSAQNKAANQTTARVQSLVPQNAITNQTAVPVQSSASQNTITNKTTASAQSSTAVPAKTSAPAKPAPIAPVTYQPVAPIAAFNSAAQTCTDDGRCQLYPVDRCREQWLTTNCRLKCNLCS